MPRLAEQPAPAAKMPLEFITKEDGKEWILDPKDGIEYEAFTSNKAVSGYPSPRLPRRMLTRLTRLTSGVLFTRTRSTTRSAENTFASSWPMSSRQSRRLRMKIGQHS